MESLDSVSLFNLLLTNKYQHHNNHKKLSWNHHSPEKNAVSLLIGNFGGESSFAVM